MNKDILADIIYESYTDNPNLSKYTGSMYFISERNFDNKTLTPKIPHNYFTQNGYEDCTTRRVCFAPSINKCLMGMSYNCAGKEFFVHKPIKDDIRAFKPNRVLVPDSKITGEIWVLSPVKVKCIGTILCTKDSGKNGIPFTYGNNNVAQLYEWDWEWIDKIIG